MPNMPMLPAKPVSSVLPRLVHRLRNDMPKATATEVPNLRFCRDGCGICSGSLRRRRTVCRKLFVGIDVAVARKFAVQQPHHSRGILVRKLGIVRDEYYKPVAGYIFEQFHYLNARICVQRARGFVGENDLRIAHDGSGNGDALHLSAGKLVGTFAHLLVQPHAS